MDATPSYETTTVLCAAIVGLAKALEYVAGLLSKRSGNGRSGEKSVEFWENEIRKAAEEGVKRALAERDEQIRRIIREEVEAMRWMRRIDE